MRKRKVQQSNLHHKCTFKITVTLNLPLSCTHMSNIDCSKTLALSYSYIYIYIRLSSPPIKHHRSHKTSLPKRDLDFKMNMMKGRFLKAWMKKWRRMGRRSVIPCAACEACCAWSFWPLLHEEKIVPSDVPKGHLVVYVGECHKRFVIKVTLLNHPLFQALLDQAQEVYDFNADSRLCIPCDENIFLSVVQCAKSPPERRLPICL